MKVGVSVKLNLSKIDKARLFKGEKGTYLDATMFIDLDNQGQFGDNGMITQDVSKEEREQGVKGAILGNVKVFYKGAGTQPQNDPSAKQANPQGNGFDDDLPFWGKPKTRTLR